MKKNYAVVILPHLQVNIVENTFLRLSSDIDNIMDPHGQQENEEVNDNLTEDIDDSEVKLLKQWKHTRQM